MLVKHILATGPNGDHRGSVTVITDSESYTYNNPSTHEQEEKTRPIYRILARTEKGQIIYEANQVKDGMEILKATKEAEQSLQKYLQNLANNPEPKTWEKMLLERGYTDR